MGIVSEKVVKGDIRAVARLIRDIDDGIPEVREVHADTFPRHYGNGVVFWENFL